MRRRKKGANIKLAFLLNYIQQNYAEKRTKSEKYLRKTHHLATCSGEIDSHRSKWSPYLNLWTTNPVTLFQVEKKKKKKTSQAAQFCPTSTKYTSVVLFI